MAVLNPNTVVNFEDPYAQKMRRGFLESAFDLASQPTPIPVQQIAGLDPLELQARTLAGGLGGFQPFLQTGANMAQQGFNTLGAGAGALGAAAGLFAPGAASAFYNPFEQDVVEQTIRDLTEKSDIASIGDRFKAVRSGAFGGSRGRLMESERNRALGRGLAEAIGGIRSKGFGLAQQAAQTAGRGLGAIGQQFGNIGRFMGSTGQQFAGLGTTGLANLQRQIQTLGSLGGLGRGIEQARGDARFDAAVRSAAEPRERLSALQTALGLLPTTTATTTFEALPGVDPRAQALEFIRSGGIGPFLGLTGGPQQFVQQPVQQPTQSSSIDFTDPALSTVPLLPGTGIGSFKVGPVPPPPPFQPTGKFAPTITPPAFGTNITGNALSTTPVFNPNSGIGTLPNINFTIR
jgi:hypothetical protein